MLAAAGSSKGASRAIFDFAEAQGWRLLSSPYALGEVRHNLSKLPEGADKTWAQLKSQITWMDDVVSINRPVIFAASKDRPKAGAAMRNSERTPPEAGKPRAASVAPLVPKRCLERYLRTMLRLAPPTEA